MTLYNKQAASAAGITPTFVAAANGDQISNALGGVLIVRTVGTGTTVTITTPGNLPNGDAYPDKALVLGTNTERWIVLGPEYCDSTGIASLSWSSLTAVTWAVIDII